MIVFERQLRVREQESREGDTLHTLPHYLTEHLVQVGQILRPLTAAGCLPLVGRQHPAERLCWTCFEAERSQAVEEWQRGFNA